ncbi:hypothetical protein ABB37_08266 [Leptomonas pyrrhocoris]|uniref:Uncharacterized protein n=1 Tax=Leptomonas pyrrhocoris TaxID=157538 RepID=A0A0M9FTI3_LEPPY|nr:hypothetical protein ABB37_08266 [Leptomonas pyrrhocoris]KPA75713.1 hypothetical protein ABB37_08266 [Leptomonas pyrrhocoris]|eukprot:XP_015654152.1 hypothetical protein ABB37_08266 [Leptomonas pyrrhocoris]
MPAGDLYRSGEGHADASRPSNRHVEETHPEKDAYVPLFGRIGGADQESSQSSSSSPYSYSFPNAHPITDDRRQRDASHEAAELPLSVSPHGTPHPAHSNPLNTAAAVSDKGWCGWAHAAMRYPLLFHACFAALQSDTVLRRLCEVREVGGEAGNGSGGSSARDMYYRPSEAVAVAWLKRKVELLRGSSVLREVLQLSEVTTTTAGAASTPSSSSSSPSTATAVHSLPQQVSATSTTPASKAAAEVPLAIAFGMVAEYVPERLHDPLAVACGLPDPSLPSSVSSVVTPSAGAKRGREGEGSSSAMPSAERNPASGGTPSAGPKSASVRRLERAGRPKGTPTLFSMFAKKPKDGA